MRGEVIDSLAGGHFMAAWVQPVPTAAPLSGGFTAISATAGRFAIRDVPVGQYTFGFQHARFDSLGFDAVARLLSVTGRGAIVTANLSLPGAMRAFAGRNAKPRASSSVAYETRRLETCPMRRRSSWAGARYRFRLQVKSAPPSVRSAWSDATVGM